MKLWLLTAAAVILQLIIVHSTRTFRREPSTTCIPAPASSGTLWGVIVLLLVGTVSLNTARARGSPFWGRARVFAEFDAADELRESTLRRLFGPEEFCAVCTSTFVFIAAACHGPVAYTLTAFIILGLVMMAA
jgi:hypothetical protein